MRLKEHERSYKLSFDNGISLEILRQGSTFQGLGNVKMRRRKLRSAELPIMPLIRTPDGHEVTSLRFASMRKGADSLTIALIPYMRRCARMEWVCYDGQDRWNVGPWEREAERDRGGSLRLCIRGIERTIGGVDFVGFSYSYKFRSRKYRIYRIHDRATWELGGRATGNSFWMQGPFNTVQKTFRNKSEGFTTSWCRSTRRAVQLQQFLPLLSVLQGFTFQFDPQSLLVTAFEAPFHCRSLFQKNPGQNYLVHWHQLCGDLGNCLEFPALQVLTAESAAQSDIERANQYCAIREELQRDYCEQSGLVRERVVVGSRLVGGNGSCLESLERGLDEVAHTGCKRVHVPGLMRILTPPAGPEQPRKGRSTSLQKAFRQAQGFVQHAHHRGMEVALALRDCCLAWVVAASMGEENPDLWRRLQGRDGNGLVARALRDEDARQLLLDHLRKVRKELGVDALFVDSILDEIADQFDWVLPTGEDAASGAKGDPGLDEDAGEIRGLAGARVSLIVALQSMGYKCPLASAGGMVVPGVSLDYDVLRGREFMFRDRVLGFPYDQIIESGAEPLEVYFRGCANRLSYAPRYSVARGLDGRLESWARSEYAAINKAYHAVRDYMEHSRLLPDDLGVLWDGADPDVRVLWAYKEFAWDVGKRAEMFDVMASKPVEPEEGVFTAVAWKAYLVQNARELSM